MQSSKVGVVVVAALTAGACTRWSPTTNYSPPRETARRLLGSPAIAETKSSSLNAGFGGSARGGSAAGALGANTQSMTLKHCVQQAELTYEQQYETRSRIKGRGWDIAGAITLGFIGVATIDGAHRNANDAFYNDPTRGYIVGGLFVASAVALMVRSYVLVPGRRPVETGPAMRTYQENKLVEATGCGLPGDLAGVQSPVPLVIQAQPAATQSPDATARLQQLDKLRASGAISEADYNRKRKEIIDSI